MRGCLFTLVLGAVALALIVVIGLPAVAAGVLTAGVRAAGLEAADTTVTVSSDPPTDLVTLHADRVRVRATDATFRGLRIAALDVTMTDVAILDRTVGNVDGRLHGVVVPNVGARAISLDTITLSGGGDAITATTSVGATTVDTLIADAIESDLGARPSSVTLTSPSNVSVVLGGVGVSGRIGVSDAGDLVVLVTSGPAAGSTVTLLRGGEDLPIRLTSASVTAGGDLQLAGDLSVGLLG